MPLCFAEAGQPKNMVYPAQNYVSLLYRNRNMYNKENCEERENGWDIAIKALLADDNLSIIDLFKYKLKNLLFKKRRRK